MSSITFRIESRRPTLAAAAHRPACAAALIGVILLLATGCARFRMPVPENFVKVEETGHVLAALTSQEDKLLVRHRGVSHNGSAKFWIDAVRDYLVTERGYTLISEAPVKTDNGLTGHRFLFELSLNNVPYRHLLVVFLTDGCWPDTAAAWLGRPLQHIYTVEFVAEKNHFDDHAPAAEKAIRKFEPLKGKRRDEGTVND